MIIHVAILDTDIPVRPVFAARGLYSSQFRTLLQSAAGRMNSQQKSQAEKIEIHTSAYDIVGSSYPALNTLRCSPRQKRGRQTRVKNLNALPIDAIIVTGSLASSYQFDEYPWIIQLQEFIQTVWREYPAVKMFGSCFGHQLIAQALLSQPSSEKEQLLLIDEKTATLPPAAHVEQCPLGFEIGIHPITLNPAFVSSASPALSTLHNREMRIQLFHGDRVISSSQQDKAALPSPWMSIGSTEISPIQGLFHPGRVLTYQGHFEFDSSVNRELVVACASRWGWTEEMIKKYMEQVGQAEQDEDDSKLAAEVVVWFFTEEDNSPKSVGAIKRFTERFMKRLCLR
jgi:GMP synthase-like glutamine amidotransferase